MNIAILASAYGYTSEHVKPWLESLRKTKFGGKVFVIVYNPQDDELLEYLKANDVFCFVGQLNGESNMATQRFLEYTQMLNSEYAKDVDYVITTDIRDVIFQKDPGVWVQNNIQDFDLIATSEGVTFRHEDWNGDNLEKHFGKNMFLKLADKETICSGIIAGKKPMMIELFKTVYDLAFFSNDPGAFVDQIFYAIAIYEIFYEKTKIVSATEDWVANLGTLKAIPENSPTWSTASRSHYSSYERIRKNKSFIEAMKCNVPEMTNGLVIADNGKPFTIIHQYDRYQPWKEKLLNLTNASTDLGFYLWVHNNPDGVDKILEKMRESFPDSELCMSCDNGEDHSEIATKYNAINYNHGKESHGFYIKEDRHGWKANEAKLWLDRLYHACSKMTSKYVMMMEEDVLVKSKFSFPTADIIMFPAIKNPISKSGMEWVKNQGGNVSYPFYSAGGGSIINREAFMKAYDKHSKQFISDYETVYEASMKEGNTGWGACDSIICVLLYANNSTFSTMLPMSNSGEENDPAPIIHNFKKYYKSC